MPRELTLARDVDDRALRCELLDLSATASCVPPPKLLDCRPALGVPGLTTGRNDPMPPCAGTNPPVSQSRLSRTPGRWRRKLPRGDGPSFGGCGETSSGDPRKVASDMCQRHDTLTAAQPHYSHGRGAQWVDSVHARVPHGTGSAAAVPAPRRARAVNAERSEETLSKSAYPPYRYRLPRVLPAGTELTPLIKNHNHNSLKINDYT